MFVPPTETTLFFSANLKSFPSCTPAPTVIAILLPFHVELVVHDEAWNFSWKTVCFKLCVQILEFPCQQAFSDSLSFKGGSHEMLPKPVLLLPLSACCTLAYKV